MTNTYTDTRGTRYQRYSVSYEFGGSSWSSEIWAVSREQAELKLRAMSEGRVDGEIVAVIPVPGAGLVGRLWNWLRGVARKRAIVRLLGKGAGR